VEIHGKFYEGVAAMEMSNENTHRWVRNQIRRLRAIILDIDPEGVLRDARAAGLHVDSIEDFRNQPHNYWRIEDLMHRYAWLAARYSVISGATAGVGGLPTAVTLGTADIANMAAQLYRFCQRLAILNGFDPEHPLQRETAEQIFLSALGFDTVAQAALRQQVSRAAIIAGKRGAYSNYIVKLIILIAEKLGVQLTTKEAAQFIPVVGGFFGATINYIFAKKVADRMQDAFRREYFRAWQANHRGGSDEPT